MGLETCKNMSRALRTEVVAEGVRREKREGCCVGAVSSFALLPLNPPHSVPFTAVHDCSGGAAVVVLGSAEVGRSVVVHKF